MATALGHTAIRCMVTGETHPEQIPGPLGLLSIFARLSRLSLSCQGLRGYAASDTHSESRAFLRPPRASVSFQKQGAGTGL